MPANQPVWVLEARELQWPGSCRWESTVVGAFTTLQGCEAWIAAHGKDWGATNHWWLAASAEQLDSIEIVPKGPEPYMVYWTPDGKRWQHVQPLSPEVVTRGDHP